MGRKPKRTREEKYPNTDYFTFHNANPHNKYTTDCVIRAISTACKINYNDVVMDFAHIQCETGEDPSYKETWSKYIENKGWVKNREPRKWNNTKYTAKEFLIKHPEITCMAKLGSHHLAAIVNGKVLDTWNSSNETIHTYWTLDKVA